MVNNPSSEDYHLPGNIKKIETDEIGQIKDLKINEAFQQVLKGGCFLYRKDETAQRNLEKVRHWRRQMDYISSQDFLEKSLFVLSWLPELLHDYYEFTWKGRRNMEKQLPSIKNDEEVFRENYKRLKRVKEWLSPKAEKKYGEDLEKDLERFKKASELKRKEIENVEDALDLTYL